MNAIEATTGNVRPRKIAGRVRQAVVLCVLGSSALSAHGNWPGSGIVRPLGELSPSAVTYIRSRSAAVGVAIYNNKNGRTYVYNADWRVRTASIIKVGVLAALLDRSQRLGRGLTDWEKSKAWWMITHSDNDATDALWWNLGPDNVMNYLRNRIGMTHTSYDPDRPRMWGFVFSSPKDFLRLVSKIRYYQLWSPGRHAYALDLMRRVIAWQAFLRAGLPAGTWEAEKCGWSDSVSVDWRVHSVGAVTAGGNTYTIAIMTRSGRGLDYGRATIAGIASRVHAAYLQSVSSKAAPAATTFRAMVTTPVLNVRSGPGTGYAIVGTLRSGAVVTVYGTSGGWYKIVYGGAYRWILGSYTRKV